MTTSNKPLLNINLRWFMLAMILANIAGQMIYSMMSLYLLDLGASVAQVGLVFTLASLAPLALQIFGGWLSDTIGRLRTIAIGSSISVFGYLILSFAPNWIWVLIGLSVEYISGAAVGPSFAAYISEQSDENQRGRVFGLTSSIYMIVTVIGPALAGFLAYRFNFHLMMRVALGFYFSATILRIWMATNERFQAKQNAELPTWYKFKTEMGAMLGLLVAGGILTWIWVTDALGDTAFNMIGELFPIYMTEIGGLNVEQVGVVKAVRGVAVIVAAPLAGLLVDRFSEKMTIATGFALQAIGILLLIISRNIFGFGVMMIIFGLGIGFIIPAYDSLISKVVPENKRGLAFGLFGTSLGILSLPFPWIGAQLWENIAPQAPFWFVVVACLVSVPIAWTKFGAKKEPQLQPTD